MALRQQMEDTNHEMVNMLIQQIGTVFNPPIQQTHNSYQTLTDQMGPSAWARVWRWEKPQEGGVELCFWKLLLLRSR